MIIIKHLQMNKISALDNLEGNYRSPNKPNPLK